jgi:hypothetical protein
MSKTWIVEEFYTTHGVKIGAVDREIPETLHEVLSERLQSYGVEDPQGKNYVVFDEVNQHGASITARNRESNIIQGKVRLYNVVEVPHE